MTGSPRPNEAVPGERWLRVLAAVVSPITLGTLIVISILTGNGISTQVRDSSTVSSVALVVGAALILGPTVLYVHRPGRYERLQQSNAEQLQAVIAQASQAIEAAKTAGASAARLPMVPVAQGQVLHADQGQILAAEQGQGLLPEQDQMLPSAQTEVILAVQPPGVPMTGQAPDSLTEERQAPLSRPSVVAKLRRKFR